MTHWNPKYFVHIVRMQQKYMLKTFLNQFFRDKLGKKVEYSQFPSPSSLLYEINIATNNTRFV